MTGIGADWQALHAAAGERGPTLAGAGRELYLRSDPVQDQTGWVTELQQPVTPSGTR